MHIILLDTLRFLPKGFSHSADTRHIMMVTAFAANKRKDYLPLQIGFLGGDRRMEVAADMLRKAGHEVKAARNTPPDQDFFQALDLLVLPYPATKDGVHVAGTDIPLSAFPLSRKTAVFGGRLPASLRTQVCFDAEEDEEYLCGNAYLTAAAGVATALRAGERAFFRVCAAVIGYGRIGKETARMLRALGAEVTVYVRRPSAVKEASLDGFHACLLYAEQAIPETLVFGTVPAPAENLTSLRLPRDALVYDLGGGLPAELRTGADTWVKTLPLRGAPGVFAPLAAGELYGGAILSAIERIAQDPPTPNDILISKRPTQKGTDP